MFCIPGYLADAFKQKLLSGEITPEKLIDMSSKERRDYFSTFLGPQNAQKVNALFESKLLLKSQQQGIITWAKQVAGISPKAQRDILSRVSKMEPILNPKDEASFLSDLAAQKLGVSVSYEEAANISALAKKTAETKAALEAFKLSGAKNEDELFAKRMAYGESRVAFEDYVNDLKAEALSKPFLEYFKPKNWGEAAMNVAGLAKSMKASLDNSVILRQGLKVLFTHPDIWARNTANSFIDMARSFRGEDVMAAVRAEILSRDNSLNGLYKQEGLDVGVREEQYPTHWPSKIPVLGRLFKMSETAFTAFQYRSRADIFDRLVEVAQKSNADIQGLGKLANTLTGRSSLGKLEPAAGVVNNLLFSPRFLKSNIDVLTAHQFSSEMGAFAKREAAINTLKIIMGVGSVLAIAKAIDKDSVELDPRSSDFGKIRVGSTRFDVSGGMASIVTLASRLLTMSSKSSVTKIVNPLNSGKFGATTGADVVYNFFENKSSPLVRVLIDRARGKDFSGNPATLQNELVNLFSPIMVTNMKELRDNPDSANKLLAIIADGLGIGTNTYSYSTNWSSSEGKEIKGFQQEVGPKEFKKANDDFNVRVNAWLDKVLDDPEYKKLSDEDKRKVITNKKIEIKNDIFQEYGYYYKKEKNPLPKL